MNVSYFVLRKELIFMFMVCESEDCLNILNGNPIYFCYRLISMRLSSIVVENVSVSFSTEIIWTEIRDAAVAFSLMSKRKINYYLMFCGISKSKIYILQVRSIQFLF